MPMTPIAPLDRTSPTFRADCDTYFAYAIPALTGELNVLEANVNAKEATASAAALAASAAAATVIATTNVTKWITGTAYVHGARVWSPAFPEKTYARVIAGAGAIDPSADAVNWAQVLALPSQTGKAGRALVTDGVSVSWGETGVKGANIASAATINLTAATGDFVHVTGTAPIAAITIPVGAERTVIFDGILTLIHGAALLLPGATNILTAANDRMIVRGDTAGANVISYTRASGKAIISDVMLLGSAAIGFVANIDFLTICTADYDKYTIEIEGVFASSVDSLCMRLANAGVVATASYWGPTIDTGSPMSGGATILFPPAVPTSGASSLTYTIEICNTNDAVKAKRIGVRGSSNSTAIIREAVYTGAAVSGFRLYFNAGATFISGTVRVYGHRNT